MILSSLWVWLPLTKLCLLWTTVSSLCTSIFYSLFNTISVSVTLEQRTDQWWLARPVAKLWPKRRPLARWKTQLLQDDNICSKLTNTMHSNQSVSNFHALSEVQNLSLRTSATMERMQHLNRLTDKIRCEIGNEHLITSVCYLQAASKGPYCFGSCSHTIWLVGWLAFNGTFNTI